MSPLDAALAGERNRLFLWLAIAIVIALTPFGINHFIQIRPVTGGAIMVVVLIIAVNAIAIYRERPPPIPHILIFLPISVTLAIAISTQGINGSFWTYPVVLLAHYTLPRRSANIVSVLITVLAGVVVWRYVAPDNAVRVVVTLLLTSLFANVFLATVARLHRDVDTLAMADPLTGAYNRRHMDSVLSSAVSLRARHGTQISLLLLDVDHFKRINDEFGHATGDDVLKKLVAVVSAALRPEDLLFRIGGEEFAVVLPQTGESAAIQVAEKLRIGLSASPILGTQPITISVGELRADGDRDSLLKRCDDALYRAKGDGRNCVRAAPADTRRTPDCCHRRILLTQLYAGNTPFAVR